MSLEERAQIVGYRCQRHLSWHSPPHFEIGFSNQYFISAACYEHAPIIGKSPERMNERVAK